MNSLILSSSYLKAITIPAMPITSSNVPSACFILVLLALFENVSQLTLCVSPSHNLLQCELDHLALAEFHWEIDTWIFSQ
jgi:hypothetical protein